MNEPSKIILNFFIEISILLFGISLVDIHLLVSILSIIVITTIAIVKFLIWLKKQKQDENKNEKFINRPL